MKFNFYQGWWQVAVALLLQGVSAASIFTGYSVVVAPFKLEFGPSNMVLMLGMTVTSLCSGLLSPSIGAALDRFSMRRLMLAGSALVAVGFLLLSITTSMVQVLVIYAVFMAMGSILLGPIASSALLARWFTRRRGLAMGIAASGSAIGGLLLPPLLQMLIDSYEWRDALRMFGVLIFALTAPVIALLVIDRPTPEQQAAEAGTAASTAGGDTAVLEPVGSVFKDRNFWLIAMIIGILFCGPMALVSNIIQFVGGMGIEASEGALLISIFSAATFTGKMLCACIVDHINKRLGLAVTLCSLAVGMLLFLQAQGFSLLVVACLITGMASGTALLFWSVILAQVYGPNRVGQMMGKMNLIIMPLTLLAPPLFGWVFDLTGSYANAFMGYMLMILLALMFLSQVQVDSGKSVAAQAAS
ncbi:MFS transporter [Aestuariicella hydrocarbonica]|uniref:MFS transporter n=1 Tax=Pseudomaricurvus hydrocarbonicus TaxID=1470433 RepID=A0A9E5JVC1_9GAMM|nr:MFS transporter [Aestuariicella hydrocarbonica]NHO65944.1 MFS transporter [Aestuariicella hydrocarbonica]